MNVLILGGNGFIGSHVVDALLLKGHSIRVFDRSAEKFRKTLPNVEYFLGDFADASMLSEALEGVDVVCHLISSTVPSTSNLNPEADIQVNLINSVRLLEQMRKQNLKRIIFLSSGGTVYGNSGASDFSENDPINPICSYGVIKAAIENYLGMYRHLYKFEPAILRASNPYGPRQGHTGVQGIIGTFLSRLDRGEAIEVWGDGSAVRDYLFVTDLAELIASVVESDTSGVFNAGSGIGYSINDVIEAIELVSGNQLEPIYKDRRSFDVERVVLRIEKAKASFGWEPRTSLGHGLAKTLEWFDSEK